MEPIRFSLPYQEFVNKMAIVRNENGFDTNYKFHIPNERAYIHLNDDERVRIVGMLRRGRIVSVVCYPATNTVLFRVDDEKVGLYAEASTIILKWFEPVQYGKVWAVMSYDPYRKSDLVLTKEKGSVLTFSDRTQALEHSLKLHAEFIRFWYHIGPAVNKKWYIWNGLKSWDVTDDCGNPLYFTVAQDAIDYIDKLAGGKYESI